MIFVADYEWPRLVKCKKQHNYISYDTDHIKPKYLTLWLMGMIISKVLPT